VPLLELLLSAQNTSLRLLGVKALQQAILLTIGHTHALVHCFTETALQLEERGLLACQTQLWMLLLQAVLNAREATLLLSQIEIHRHLHALLLRLQTAQQLKLITAHQFCRS
jgi:hypothetical protein